jgi:tetratricopeptide (TPR) repeat protein
MLRLQHRLAPGSDGEAFAHSRLATLLAAQGRHAEAETEFRATIDLLRRVLDPMHERIFSELRNLGVTVARLGRLKEGLAIMDTAYRGAVARKGDHAIGPAYIGGQRGYLLLWDGRIAEASTALREAERVVFANAPADHPYLRDVNYWMGMLAYYQHNYPEAVKRMSAALEVPTEQPADTIPHRAAIACGLGMALAKVGRTAEAVPLLRRTCPVFDKHAAEQPQMNRWSREVRSQLGIH